MRGIKPEFWTDPDVVDVSPFARLLFIGLWGMACDNGHVQDSPKRIKMTILPADEVSTTALLDELAVELIVRNGGWLTIPTLPRHQRIDRRYFRTCDMPGCSIPDSGPVVERKTRSVPAVPPRVPAVRPLGQLDEGEGEGEGEEDQKTPATKTVADFDEFWKRYPKRADRGHALTAFKTALTKTDLPTLLAAADAYTEQTATSERKFIKNGATWLRGECWLDEAPEPVTDWVEWGT